MKNIVTHFMSCTSASIKFHLSLALIFVQFTTIQIVIFLHNSISKASLLFSIVMCFSASVVCAIWGIKKISHLLKTEAKFQPPLRIAIYWDFENIDLSLRRNRADSHGKNSQPKQGGQLVDITAVMKFINTFGVISINRAFGNWVTLASYREALLQNCVELTQVFHAGPHGKNGADIKLSLQCLDDINSSAEIDIVVVLGGDSDFIPLAIYAKKHGKKIIGIGCRQSTNQFWVNSCNQFAFYDAIVGKYGTFVAGQTKTSHPTKTTNFSKNFDKTHLICAIHHAIDSLPNTRPGWVLKSSLLPRLRLNADFIDSHYGSKKLNDLLNICEDDIEVTSTACDHEVRIKPTSKKTTSSITPKKLTH